MTAGIGAQTAGSYQLTAKVDEANTVVELNDANNSYTNPTALVVKPVQSSDLVASASWSPSNPAAGNTVSFWVTVKNQGTQDSAAGAQAISLTLLDSTGATVKTLTGSVSGVIAAGASASPVTVGSWTAVNGTLLKPITLSSTYAWLYGSETAPGNDASAGGPRHIYDEANIMLGTTVPAGSVIKLRKDAANTSQYAIDFINTEQVAPVANPDPAHYVVPTGFAQQDVQNAFDKVRMDTTAGYVGVYLPAGDYPTANKFQVYGKAMKVVGAGPWYTRFFTQQDQENTDAGFSVPASGNGSTFSGSPSSVTTPPGSTALERFST